MAPKETSKRYEPDKFVEALIARTNETITNLHKSAVWLFGIGAALVAIALSTKDTSILVAQNTTVPQISLSIPVTLTIALGPFLFLGAYLFVSTQVRGVEALVASLDRELAAAQVSEEDQARLRMLVAQTPFVQGAQRHMPPLLEGFLPYGLRIVFPLAVLMSLEISTIRLQNEFLTFAQQLAIVLFIVDLLWRRWAHGGRLWTGALRFQAAVGAMAVIAIFAWTSVPRADDWALSSFRVYDDGTGSDSAVQLCQKAGWGTCAAWALSDPLDMAVCPLTNWGCRYMRLYYVKLTATPDPDGVKAIYGLDLHQRNLRFADLDGADFGDADLTNSDLRGAFLRNARLSDADMHNTKLQCTHLRDADFGCDIDGGDSAVKAEVCKDRATEHPPTYAWRCHVAGNH